MTGAQIEDARSLAKPRALGNLVQDAPTAQVDELAPLVHRLINELPNRTRGIVVVLSVLARELVGKPRLGCIETPLH